MRLLITGGGTGGHVSPALAVVQTLRSHWKNIGKDRPLELLYLGSATGVEATQAAKADIPFVGVQSGKLRRAKNPIRMLNPANIRDLFRVPVGVVEAFAAVRRFKPDVVLATGGYVSVPPVIAAALLKTPILIHEQTVQIGLATRINARFAARIALTFAGSAEELPPNLREKTFATGNPVREIIFNGDRAAAIARYGFADSDNDLPTVYVTGGAQGSRIINRAVEAILPELLTVCRIVHQCGKQPDNSEQDFDRLTLAVQKLPVELQKRYHLIRFVGDEIGDLFALTDLLVGRSGAGTVSEACALGKPALYIPLVPTGGDEQTRNAQRSVDAGGAVILKQDDCTGERLLVLIRDLLDNKERLSTMGKAARTLATPDAANDIVDALIALAKKAL